MTAAPPGLLPYLLDWDEAESIDCVAQAILTNETAHHFWVSCTTWIGRGVFVLDDAGRPVGVRLEATNKDPLAGLDGYGHIGDGDYVVGGEVWFGLEDGANPRVLPGAIGRYDADTLGFLGIHPHPWATTMAFVAHDPLRHRAYSMNWTDNHGELLVFDAAQMEWKEESLPVQDCYGEEAWRTEDFGYVQGSDVIGNTLYLMGDDYQSTLYEIRLPDPGANHNATAATCVSATALGLGHEREGISVYDGFKNPSCPMLTMNNQWYTWEDQHYAGIACIGVPGGPSLSSSSWGVSWGSLLVGAIVGGAAGWVGAKITGRRRDREQYSQVAGAAELTVV